MALVLLGVANVAAIVALWLSGGGVQAIDDTASALTSLGRLSGLLGAYGVLVQVLLVGRLPVLDQLVGFDRLTVWHRLNGRVALILLLAHAGLILAGYSLADGNSPVTQLGLLIEGYPGVITAIAGLAALVAVVVTSLVIVRRRLRYETWYFVHLYTYLGIALAFSHQLATGADFVGAPVARAYWYALYIGTLGALVLFRIVVPVVRNAYYRLRVERVVVEAPGYVSLEVEGAHLDRLKARTGQFFTWRFLTRDHWWEAHPFSLSAAPDGRRLRITVKGLGDHTSALGSIRPGTRVLVEGPFGVFTSAARRRPRVALIAGGVGITPIRALLEDMPGEAGDIAVVYRVAHADEVILRDELDELARRRKLDLHYVVGDHREVAGLLSAEHLCELVPDIAGRDVYVCGPPSMTEATGASLRRAGVPRRQIITESFAL